MSSGQIVLIVVLAVLVDVLVTSLVLLRLFRNRGRQGRRGGEAPLLRGQARETLEQAAVDPERIEQAVRERLEHGTRPDARGEESVRPKDGEHPGEFRSIWDDQGSEPSIWEEQTKP